MQDWLPAAARTIGSHAEAVVATRRLSPRPEACFRRRTTRRLGPLCRSALSANSADRSIGAQSSLRGLQKQI